MVRRRVETRFIERLPNGDWRYAAYVWNEAGTQARLASAGGVVLAVRDAPGGRYVVPGEADCRACHEGAAVPVLGVNTAWSGPWGVSYTANLTPDAETGLGKWTLRNFADQDLDAIYSYLRTIPVASNRVPEPLPPAQ